MIIHAAIIEWNDHSIDPDVFLGISQEDVHYEALKLVAVRWDEDALEGEKAMKREVPDPPTIGTYTALVEWYEKFHEYSTDGWITLKQRSVTA